MFIAPLLGAVLSIVACPTSAAEPTEPPPLAPALIRLLDQDYLSADEKRSIRVRHGLWTDEDLSDPASRARAALIRGAIDDESLLNEGAPKIERASGALLRGDPLLALTLVEGDDSLRAARVRAESYVALGRVKEADAALDRLVVAMQATRITDAAELAEGVRGLLLRARLRGPEMSDGGDFHVMNNLLAHAREELDKLSWEAHLAEAILFNEKGRDADAGGALQAALSLNPRSAEAWSLLGRISVDGFEFDQAEGVAERLDELAGGKGSSADAAIVLARTRARQYDAQAADSIVAEALQRFPSHRGLLAMSAVAKALRFDFVAADSALERIDALSPGSPDAYFEVGRALSSARQYEEASRYLNEAVKRAPNWPQPIIELGLLEMQSGRDGHALDALERAAKLDTFDVRAKNSLTLARELRSYASIESEHFIVRYKPGDDEILAKEMPAALERIFDRVTGDGPGGIDFKPARKTVIELMPNHRWFSVRITGMPRVHTIAAATGPVIAMEAPREGPGHLVGEYDWQRVVQHEYVHTVTLARTKNRLPHWFTEASAVYLEDKPRDYSTCQLLKNVYAANQMFDLDNINLGFIRPRKPTDRSLAYAQGHWMYEHMIERYGPRVPLDLMDRYARGEREEDAFKAVMKVGKEEFLKGFRNWAKSQLVEWGMMLPDGVPTVDELLKQAAAEGDSPPSEPTPELVAKWLDSHPNHPDVLKLAITQRLDSTRGEPADDMIPLLEKYAEARPVDPLPHKLLAKLHMSRKGSGDSDAKAIEHLEYLDAREQHSTSYAKELARRYAALKSWTKAMEKAERVVGIAPYDADAREFAATISLRADDIRSAERHIRALVVIEPDRELHKKRLEAVLAKRDSKGGQ